jgi:hypothetical protein
MGEFATPLRTMNEMEQGKIAGFGPKERQQQTHIFIKKLLEVIQHPQAQDEHAKNFAKDFLHLPYRGDNSIYERL